MRGLLGRSSLPAGEGLLLSPAPSVHTAFMRFPIDAVFLDRDFVVLKIVGPLAPWRAASARGARSVLELAGGEGARRGVRVGDRLACVSEGDISDGTEHVEEPLDGRAPDPDPRSIASRAEHSGRRLLLVSRDRRFRAVMAALLSARGFTVLMSTRYADLPEAELPRADVVVVDASESLAEAERDAREAALTAREVAVVFVGDDEGGPRTSAARVIPKWQSFEQLCDEIEAARSRTLAELAARRVGAEGERSTG
jgi:uncharacterized membrane protein (UPF0127 family)